MADIDVQRKTGLPWLWWIVGFIVLILIIWGVTELMDGDTPAATVTPASMVQPAVTSGSATFVT